MIQLPCLLYTAEQVREMDRRIIHESGVSGYELMQRAGGVVFRELCRLCREKGTVPTPLD